MQIYSFSPFGYEGALVSVEVDLRRGIPAVDIVGLADGAVRESRERMQAAVRNSGFDFPPERILISLSPADLKKEGAGFDLPVALGVLCASRKNQMNVNPLNGKVLVMGELELSGKVRSVKGIHAAVSTAASAGITKCIVPAANADEAMEVDGISVYGADTLCNAFSALNDSSFFTARNSGGANAFVPEGSTEINGVAFPPLPAGEDFSNITGQKELVRALQLAAAGGHNILAVGAPGCGKTMAIRMMPSIMPLLTQEEAQSVTRIWSLAGLLQPSEPLVRTAPFRIPHQTATIEGICGGGVNCRPGEISLAHNGVLFLDEAAEFRTSVLQMLRVPVETGSITLSRAGRSTIYPAQFQLAMAVNPCPCGNFGSRTKICLCSARSIEQYWRKFSAPLLDRIDLRVFVENGQEDENSAKAVRYGTASTAEIREGIARATVFRRKRQTVKNARLRPDQIAEFCRMDSGAKSALETAEAEYGFSPRASACCMKVARTAADMDTSDIIKAEHIEEAIEYRKVCSSLVPKFQ